MKNAYVWMGSRKLTIKEAAGRYSGLRLRRESPGIDRNFEAYLMYERIITNSQFRLIESTVKEWQICRHCRHWQFDGRCTPLQDELSIEVDSGGYEKAYVTVVGPPPKFSCGLWESILYSLGRYNY